MSFADQLATGVADKTRAAAEAVEARRSARRWTWLARGVAAVTVALVALTAVAAFDPAVSPAAILWPLGGAVLAAVIAFQFKDQAEAHQRKSKACRGQVQAWEAKLEAVEKAERLRLGRPEVDE